jgi:hypothetical protein
MNGEDALGPPGPLELDIETFGERIPALNPALFLEPTRSAFADHHTSPATIRIYYNGLDREALVRFQEPDPRTSATLERETIVEFGAILMAGLLLRELEGKRIDRVAGRGQHVDYFLGDVDGGNSGSLRSVEPTVRASTPSGHGSGSSS